MNKKKISVITIFLVSFLIVLSGCSEHDKLLRDGWEVNEHEDRYSKIEEYPITSDESKRILEEIEGFWIDTPNQLFYVVFDEDGILIEGYDMHQFYPYNEIAFAISQTIHVPDGIKGDLAPPSEPMYEFRIDDPGVFDTDGTIDYLHFLISPEDEESLENITIIFSIVKKEGFSGGYLVHFERTDGTDIPYDYKYARGVNYSYYVEQQIRDEGMITTGKTEEEIAAEKERIAEKKEQEKREEERRKEEEKRTKEQRERQELEAKKEKEAQEARNIVESHMNNILGTNYTISFTPGYKSYSISPGHDVFGGFDTFIVNEKHINGKPSEEWMALKAAAQKSSEEIYNTYSDGDNIVTIEDPGINSTLLQYENGDLIFNAID